MDTRWAAGVSTSTDTRIEPLFIDAVKVAYYRHRQESAEAFGGWSEGLVNQWTHRYSVGLSYLQDTYNKEPGLPAPMPPLQIPPDQTLTAPFFRYELVHDNYEKVKNRDLIERRSPYYDPSTLGATSFRATGAWIWDSGRSGDWGWRDVREPSASSAQPRISSPREMFCPTRETRDR